MVDDFENSGKNNFSACVICEHSCVVSCLEIGLLPRDQNERMSEKERTRTYMEV